VSEVLQRYDGPWDESGLEHATRNYVEGSKWSASDLFMTLRVAMTGRTASPPLFAVMHVLGQERCLACLEDAVAYLQT
jgi:glutamyl-tRNA synthetase